MKITKKNFENIYNDIISKYTTIFEDYYEYIISTFICILILIICMMIESCSPFGINAVVNEDGLIQIFPEFVTQVTEIKSGHIFPFYTLNIGGFKDMFNMTGMNYIITPWYLLFYRFIPESLYYFFYVINYFLYFLLSNFSIIFYMKHKHYNPIKNKKMLIMFGLCYTLCSYSALYFRYMAGFKYMPFIPLIVLGMEQMIYKRKSALYIMILWLLMIFNPYQAFLACEFLVLFFFTLNYENIKHFIKSGIRFAISSLVAGGISALWLIPYFFMITGSVYSTRDNEKPSISNWFSSIFKIFNEYRFANIQESISSTSSQTSIYCGLIIILIIPLFIISKKIDKKYKTKQLLLLLLLFLAFDNELLNYVLHGFHYQSLVPNRFAIFFVFLLFNTLGNIDLKEEIRIDILAIVYFAIFFFYMLIYWIYNGKNISSLISSTLLLFYIIMILLYKAKKKKVILSILFYTILFEVSLNFIILFTNTIGKTGNDYLKTINIVNDISNEIPDMKNPFNKTEYLSSSGTYNDLGNITNISTISYFASDYSDDTTYRSQYYNIAFSPNTLFYLNGNPLADMMLGIKYHIENSYDDTTISLYNKIYSYNQYNVYENPYYIAPMFTINSESSSVLKNIDLNNYENVFEYQNAISNAICGEDLFRIVQIKEYNDNLSQEDNYYRYGDIFTTSINNDIINMQEVNIKLNEKDVYVACDYILLYLGDSSQSGEELTISVPIEKDTVTDTINQSDYKPSIGIINWETMQKMHNVLSSSKSNNCKSNGHNITATIDVKESSTLYISLPYYEGWTAYVDGKKTNISRFMGSMGINVEPGQHDIKLTYIPKGVKPAIYITIFTLLFIILYTTLCRKREIAKKENQENSEIS